MITVYVVGETHEHAKALATDFKLLGVPSVNKPVTAFNNGRQYVGCMPDLIVHNGGSQRVLDTVETLKVGQGALRLGHGLGVIDLSRGAS